MNFNQNMGNNFPTQFNNPYQPKIDRYIDLQQQTQTAHPSNTNMNFIVVENIQKAKEQIVPYGYTMWMRDSSEPYQYIKSVDQVGTPSFKVLRVEDVTNELLNNSIQTNTTNVEFVSLDNFNELSNKVNQLQDIVNQYNNLLNQIIEKEQTIQKETKKTTTKPISKIEKGGVDDAE